MKKLLLFALLFAVKESTACTTCNKQIQQGIYNSTFLPNLLTMLSAFIVLAIIIFILSILNTRKHKSTFTNSGSSVLNPVPLTTAAMVLGIGLGGFVDGIFFHQILQWHEMLSNKLPPVDLVTKSVNMFWDGVFHFFCLVVVLIGTILLWKLLKRKDINSSGKLLTAGLLQGFAIFNIVEGIIDHHLLKLHNVREITDNTDLWNFGFLGVSFIMLVIGLILTKQGAKDAKAAHTS